MLIDSALISWLGSIIGYRPYCYAGDSLLSLNEIILATLALAHTGGGGSTELNKTALQTDTRFIFILFILSALLVRFICV